MSSKKEMRLQKMLADSGLASRRKAEQFITNGEVTVNGRVAQIGDKVEPQKDIVSFRGKCVHLAKKNYYIMLNKPRGYVTTMHDEQGRRCVAELVSDVGARVYPVGRLDRNSEGLLLLTNDGDFANNLIHPSMHIPRTYRVTVKSSVSEEHLVQFNVGIEIDGRKTQPADAWVISSSPERSVLKVVIYEGRNRQIRKMCEALGLEVTRLKRVAIGQLKLGMLGVGKWRELSAEEVNRLGAKNNYKGK